MERWKRGANGEERQGGTSTFPCRARASDSARGHACWMGRRGQDVIVPAPAWVASHQAGVGGRRAEGTERRGYIAPHRSYIDRRYIAPALVRVWRWK